VNLGAERDRFALLVHELSSPVAALSAITEAIVEDEFDRDSVRELALLALRACRSIERIVGDAALGSLRLEPIDVDRLLGDVVATAVLAGAPVRLIATGSPPLKLEADPVRLRQALDNLIQNAVVHSRAAEITLRRRLQAGSLYISVSDAGRGIELADQERIFEPGARLEAASAGSGLGLAVVRAVAEAHGGSVQVVSAPGEGATFTIALPLGTG
jgi:two-component system sensor histidine kinase BaeS